MANRYIGNAFPASLSLAFWIVELCGFLCLSKTQQSVQWLQWSGLKSAEAEWRPAVFGEPLVALKIWKSLVQRGRQILGQSQDYSKDLLPLKPVLKALRCTNTNLSRLKYNLYCAEMSSAQHEKKPQLLEINYLTCSKQRNFRAEVCFFFLPSSSFELIKIRSDDLLDIPACSIYPPWNTS